MQCWVCKLNLKDHSELKKHMQSMLHKENAKTHCIYKLLKEPLTDKSKANIAFKVPEPRNSPRLSARRTSGEIAMRDISPQRGLPQRKSPCQSPVAFSLP